MAVASPQIKHNMVTMDRLQDIYSTVSQHVVAHASAVTSRQRKISISAAVALVAFYTVYRVVTPPAKLRHIPSMGFFSYLNAFLRGKQLHDISKNVVLPHAVNVDNGVYLVRYSAIKSKPYARYSCSCFNRDLIFLDGPFTLPVLKQPSDFCSSQVHTTLRSCCISHTNMYLCYRHFP